MYRKNQVIPKLTQARYPTRFVVFDTEAYRSGFILGVEVQTLRMFVARYVKLDDDLNIIDTEYHDGTSGEGLYGYIDRLSRKDHSLYVFAHNLKYDLQLSNLLRIMLERGWSVAKFVIDDPPTFIVVRRGRFSVTFVDTFNYFQYSLAQMGDQLGLSKLTMPPDEAGYEDFYVYCKRDVDVLTEYLLSYMRFLRGNGLGSFALTIASQAFRAYRTRFMTTPIELHNRPEVLLLERDGYYGGRNEAYFIGDLSGADWYKLDVNSMYPYVMRNNPYPVKLIAHAVEVGIDRLKALVKNYYVIARVRLDTSNNLYPVKRKHKLVFPVGCFETVLHHAEIEFALTQGDIAEVLEVAIYDRAYIFDDYVDFFYGVKVEADQEGNKIKRTMAKLFLNSLYGKFGQREVISKIVDNDQGLEYGRYTGYSESLGQRVTVNYIGHQIEIKYTGGESIYSFPAIAGAVTAYGRVYLYNLIQRAGADHVMYCDTDSLFTDRCGYDRLMDTIDPRRLGALKLEGVSDRLIIRGCKDYTFSKDDHRKGVPKNAVAVGPETFEYDQFRGGITWLREGLKEGVTVRKVYKTKKSEYDKGIVLASGRVVPLRLS